MVFFLCWISTFATPKMLDNGCEFNNIEMCQQSEAFSITMTATAENIWSNSICECLNVIIGGRVGFLLILNRIFMLHFLEQYLLIITSDFSKFSFNHLVLGCNLVVCLFCFFSEPSTCIKTSYFNYLNAMLTARHFLCYEYIE